ncbi:hypothetical protein Taro_041970 [Colocasia esculenta]|uniref:Uncharacterized protein n=1 Tax=Colocasia esculenta TaxID=4460 RepID=A0A843WH86_COLES|nr:hypothetical protein [Colocasia esculenta]
MEMTESKYFDELLHMSFFEPLPRSMFVENMYVMHDLIHDLAQYVSKDDCFRLEDQKLVEIPDTVRHVSVNVSRGDQIDIINKLCCYEKLRTLRFTLWCRLDLNTNNVDQLFLKLKMLRVLELRYRGNLPGSIGDLKHLRYIDLQCNIGLQNLPESLGNLYNLQVLSLCYCRIRELPDSIGDLKHLIHIDLEGNHGLTRLPESLGNLYNLQVLNLSYCCSLRMLPATMSQLVSLRHLQTDDYKLVSRIDGVGKLTGLHELQVRGRQLRELGGMCMLRQLAVYNLEEVGSKEEAIQARLRTMECLQVLQLEWSDRGASSIKPELEEEVLQALRPNKGIQVLGIRGYGGVKSPDWMEVSTLTSFSSLSCVSLEDCPNWQVPPCSFLGQLRHLECLEIEGMPEWEEWSCPVLWDCLLELTIHDCPKLKEFPLLPPTLKSLSLNGVGISRVEEGGVETTSSLDSPPTSASCDNLTSIGWLLQQQLPDLEEIEISVCEILVSLPEKGFGHLVSLKRLRIQTHLPAAHAGRGGCLDTASSLLT